MLRIKELIVVHSLVSELKPDSMDGDKYKIMALQPPRTDEGKICTKGWPHKLRMHSPMHVQYTTQKIQGDIGPQYDKQGYGEH